MNECQKSNINTLKIKNHWQKKLIEWYLINKRNLPWRKQINQNFYSIWLSEVMLQQTGVKTVIPYYLRFKKKWPNLKSIGEATLEDILKLWQGLGYYQRAKNFHKSIQILKNKRIKNYEDLLDLPGVGKYTAAAISAILYDEQVGVVDGNIKRILSRVFGLNISSKNYIFQIENIAKNLTPKKNNKFYCQALMDLGAMICKPQNPVCCKCPIKKYCFFEKKSSIDESLKITKRKKKRKYGVVFYIKSNKSVFIKKSNENFLHGLMKLPHTRFILFKDDHNIADEQKLLQSFLRDFSICNNYKNYKPVTHHFTDFYLKLIVVKIELNNNNNKIQNGFWVSEKKIFDYPFSTLMKKVINRIWADETF